MHDGTRRTTLAPSIFLGIALQQVDRPGSMRFIRDCLECKSGGSAGFDVASFHQI